MDTFTLSRNFCNFAFENPEKINPWHYAIYFFAIEHCNRLWWKEKFWFPSQMVMEATGIKNWRTYQKYLQDLIDFWFIKMIEVSKNQYSSNIIAIVKNTKALDKALDKALQKHHTKQRQSIDSIDIQETNIQIYKETNQNTMNDFIPKWKEQTVLATLVGYFIQLWWQKSKKETWKTLYDWYISIVPEMDEEKEFEMIKWFYNYWNERRLNEDMENKNWKITFSKTWNYNLTK